MCFDKAEVPTLFDNLGRPLEIANTDHTLWNDKCDYIQLQDARNYNQGNIYIYSVFDNVWCKTLIWLIDMQLMKVSMSKQNTN